MSNFKQTYMDHWIALLYNSFPTYFENTKNRIIKEAYLKQDLVYYPADIAYYQGVAYADSLAPLGSNPQRIDLDQVSFDKMTALFQEKIDIANEQTIIKGYLRRVLNLSISTRDVTALLPESICSHLVGGINQISIDEVTLPEVTILPEKRTEFIRKNKQFSDMISERLLTNLLLNQ